MGDDEQSIFSWRGADPSLARRLQRDFEIPAPTVLDINCRCSIPIFEAARKVLRKDDMLFEKSIRAVRPGHEPVIARGFENEIDEATWVTSDLLADLARSQLSRGEYAILYRTHEMGGRMEQTLLAHGIPCQLAKGRALIDDPVIGQLVSSLRIALSPDSELEIEALAKAVLPEPLLLRLDAQAGVTLLDRVNAYARTHSDVDAKSCWRLIYQVENLKGLRGVHHSLPDLVDGILALGVGRHVNPLERLLDRLVDPQTSPRVVGLADLIARTHRLGGRILVAPAHGLEIPITLMLRRALPDLAARYLRGSEPASGDVILGLSEMPPSGAGTVVRVDDRDGLRTTTVFKALQMLEARSTKRLLNEYVVFDTETTDKDISACEV
ncbi:MAG: 3'-5' exonuclease, partial [Mycobacterium sp.]